MDSETNNILRQLEEENGGKLNFKTYALYLGFSGEGAKNLGGLLYSVNGRMIFEDFEKEGGLLGLLVKRKDTYKKTKFSFPIEEITDVYTVTRSAALRSIQDGRLPSDIPPASKILKILSRTVTQIRLKDGQAYYFEMIDEKPFKLFIDK